MGYSGISSIPGSPTEPNAFVTSSSEPRDEVRQRHDFLKCISEPWQHRTRRGLKFKPTKENTPVNFDTGILAIRPHDLLCLAKINCPIEIDGLFQVTKLLLMRTSTDGPDPQLISILAKFTALKEMYIEFEDSDSQLGGRPRAIGHE